MMTRPAIALLLLLASGSAPRQWADLDHDCKSTRAEVIEAQGEVHEWSRNGCSVLAATIHDPYSGSEITTDTAPQSIEIDHVIPVSVAWKRRNWTKIEWQAFYNDMDNLLAVRTVYNRRKSDRMPDEWCPVNVGARFRLARIVRRVAGKYRIPLTSRETNGLRAWAGGSCYAGSVMIGG